MVAIVEYPSPAAFLEMMTSKENASKFKMRLQGLDAQYLIPMRPGWFHLDRAAAQSSNHIKSFDQDNVWTTKSGLVGGSAQGARVGRLQKMHCFKFLISVVLLIGETSSTKEQALSFIKDTRLGAASPLWHLNLLNFKVDPRNCSFISVHVSLNPCLSMSFEGSY